MKFTGILRTGGSAKNTLFSFAYSKKWTNINYTNQNISLEIHYDAASPVIVIDNATKLSLCDDKLYVPENKIKLRERLKSYDGANQR